MGTKKNRYEKESEKESLLGTIATDLETKGDAKNSAIETFKDIVVGVLGGGVVGAALGRASLLVGIAVSGISHYAKSRLGTIFGIGMMASGGLSKADKPVGELGEQDMMDGVKDRVLSFKEGLTQKLFLDKILKSKKTAEKKEESTNGVGEVQYFTYPESKELLGESKELDMSALEKIEKQIASSGERFAQKQEVKGVGETEEMNSVGDTDEMNGKTSAEPLDMGDVDPSEMNL